MLSSNHKFNDNSNHTLNDDSIDGLNNDSKQVVEKSGVYTHNGHLLKPQKIWHIDLQHTLGQGETQFNVNIQFKSVAQRIVLLGPSGAGKSQTLMMIAGLVKPKKGFIQFKEHTLLDTSKKICMTPQQRRVSYMFQDYALFEHLTVSQNIGFALSHGLFNPGLKHIDDKVFVWLKRLGMADAASKYPHQLSGGQKQRVALARSLVHQPDALLLDEPFAALDRDIRGELRSLLIDIQAELNLPMILITHDAEDAQAFAQETIQISAGKIL
jgi:molybdate transport system ATP-binding protein